jgi:hypothetical protein
MRQIVLLFFVFIVNSFGYSQNNQIQESNDSIIDETKDVLNSIFCVSNDSIYYTEKCIVYNDAINAFKKNTTFSDRRDTIHLTNAEHAYILSMIDKSKLHTWEPNMFKNSSMLNSSINEMEYLKSRNYKKEYSDYTNVYSFAQPIFFKQNVCLVYYRRMCGGECGYEVLRFYKKENNQWKKWIVIQSGVY